MYLYKILQNIFSTYKGIKWIQLSYLILQMGIILSNGSSSQHIHLDFSIFVPYFIKYLQRFLKLQNRHGFHTEYLKSA